VPATRRALPRCAAHNVKFHTTATKAIHHPAVGELEVTGEGLILPGDPGLTIVTYTVEPNSPSAQALNFLASYLATPPLDTLDDVGQNDRPST